jgi:MOSC domain-containing protein YiiM
MAVLTGLLTGSAAPFGPSGEESAIRKRQVKGVTRVNTLGIDGDEHVYGGHGGPDKAVLHYAFEHYTFWAGEFPQGASHFGSPGVFGENFSTIGMSERSVCIGDRYRLGDLVLEITQPRQPCWKLGYRVGIPEIPEKMQATATTGWYYRVIQPAQLQVGLEFVLMDRPLPDWTLARLIISFYKTPLDLEFLGEIESIEQLGIEWREMARRRRISGEVEDWSGRIFYLP